MIESEEARLIERGNVLSADFATQQEARHREVVALLREIRDGSSTLGARGVVVSRQAEKKPASVTVKVVAPNGEVKARTSSRGKARGTASAGTSATARIDTAPVSTGATASPTVTRANTSATAPAKQQEAESAGQEKAKQQKEAQQQDQERRGLLGALRKGLASGTARAVDAVVSNKPDDGKDIVGTAAGGPFWSAAKEISEVAGGLRDKAGDENSLLSKAGQILKGRFGRKKDTLPEGVTRDKRGRLREGGKLMGKDRVQALGLSAAKEGAKAAQETVSLLEDDKKISKRRHRETLDELKRPSGDPDGGGGGLDLMDLVGGRGRRRGRGLIGRMFRGAGRGVAKVGGALAAGGAGLGGLAAKAFGGLGKVAGAGGGLASRVMGGIGGKLGGKIAAKGLGRATMAIPVVGQAIAAVMAGVDAVKGFTDKNMQQEAFGLKEGEAATIGEKMASSLANVLDMGGLGTGLMGLFGFDVNTADIARFIGGGERERTAPTPPQNASLMGSSPQASPDMAGGPSAAAVAKPNPMGRPRPQRPPVIERKDERQTVAKQHTDLAKAVEVGVANAMKSTGGKDPAKPPVMPIGSEFDDATLTLIAHDRL